MVHGTGALPWPRDQPHDGEPKSKQGPLSWMWACHGTLLLELISVVEIEEYAVLLADERLWHKRLTMLCNHPNDHLEHVAKRYQRVSWRYGRKEGEKGRNLGSAGLKSCKQMLQMEERCPSLYDLRKYTWRACPPVCGKPLNHTTRFRMVGCRLPLYCGTQTQDICN